MGNPGGGGICNKTAHQIRVRVNACAVHAYISCERMRSACLKFVPQNEFARRLRVPRIEASAALQVISAAAFCRCDVGQLSFFFSFFFCSFLVDSGNL